MTDTNNKIIFNCPNCGKKLGVDETKRGLSAMCPNCGKRLTIPGPDKK